MRVHYFLVYLLVAMPVLSVPVSPQEHNASEDDWVVHEDTVMRGTTKDVQGDVVIASGVRLTLEGGHLRVGGILHVLPNATLELRSSPDSGAPSRLSEYPGGTGFWINIEGNVTAKGKQSTEITGFHGNGLTATLPDKVGGMKVYGNAELEGVHIHDGTAGLFVAEGASMSIWDSTVEYLGEAAITTFGTLKIHNTTIAHNEINLVGKDTCDIQVQKASLLDAGFEQALINNCRMQIRHSVLQGAAVGVIANNGADVLVENGIIKDYEIDGLGSYAGPGTTTGTMSRPVVRFHNVTLDPAPGAQRGADVMGARLVEFVNVTVPRHASHGIQASQATLSIQDSTFEQNNGYGIRLVGGRFAVDPLAVGNQFGLREDGTNNMQGAISHLALHRFVVVKEQDDSFAEVEGVADVKIFFVDGTVVPFVWNRGAGPSTTETAFEAYTTEPDGTPQYLGPFEYEVTHSMQTFAGSTDADEQTVTLIIEESLFEKAGALVLWGIPSLFVAAGATLLFLSMRSDSRNKGQDDQ